MKYVLMIKQEEDVEWNKLRVMDTSERDREANVAELRNQGLRWQYHYQRFATAQFRILSDTEFHQKFGVYL